MTTISTFLLILRRSCVVGAIVGAADRDTAVNRSRLADVIKLSRILVLLGRLVVFFQPAAGANRHTRKGIIRHPRRNLCRIRD